MDYSEIVNCPIDDDDNIGVETVGEYIEAIIIELFETEEAFDSKRPFGNSGWVYNIYHALIKGGYVEGTLDEDGYIDTFDEECANQLVLELIPHCFKE